jgi:PTH1 family peptidyl-tRNA hydrolase
MFRRAPKSPEAPPEWILVGLGNPGPEYRGTRHNVGFDVIDILSERHRIKIDRSKHKARYGLGEIAGHPVLLVKPMTYMNLSGQAVAPFAREHGLKPERVLVVADDLDLDVGRVRLKPKGSAGGHNGHKSLIASLGTQEYPRIKIGIGSVDRSVTIDHVLGPFSPEERDLIRLALARAADGAERVVTQGVEAGMNFVNEVQRVA